MRKLLLVIGFSLFSVGCASIAHQTDAIVNNRRDLSESRRVEGVEFIEQSKNYCGPATLAMAMGWAGKPISPEALGEQVFTPGKQGALQLDMISASRRQGMLAMQISGLPALLRELDAGHPVIVLENLAFDWYPYWHYSVALGYDLKDPSILMHSGSKKDWSYDLRKFERNWKYSGYWALVVLPPGSISASATELEHSAAAAGLEQAGFGEKAELSYKAILSRWPTSLGSLIGMGNITFSRGDGAGSISYLERAVKAHPENAAAWHNLAFAQGKAGKKKSARKSALRALELVPDSEKEGYRASLEEFLAKASRINHRS